MTLNHVKLEYILSFITKPVVNGFDGRGERVDGRSGMFIEEFGNIGRG